MNSVLQEVARFPSKSSPGKIYVVKKDTEGVLYCDCPAWKFKPPGKDRGCKHISIVLGNKTLFGKFINTAAEEQHPDSNKKVAPPITKKTSTPTVALIEPMLAQAGKVEDLLNDPVGFAVGKKFDGFRELMYIDLVGKVTLMSRSGADHSANVPHLTGKPIPWLANTIIDGEGIAPSEQHGETKTIFGSDPDVAIAAQTKIGKAVYKAFDIMKFRGKDVMDLPLKERAKLLSTAVLHLNLMGFTAVEQESLVQHGMLEFFKKIVGYGGEGVVLKDLNAPYLPGSRNGAWVKIKKVATWDTIIIGFTAGKGKYEGLIGAVRYGFWQNGVGPVEAGKSSGMTDADRVKFASNPEYFIGKVAEIEGQEIGSGGAIRFPRFLRIREDKTVAECVLNL